eukprot:3175364-Amphidinium_carterae.1
MGVAISCSNGEAMKEETSASTKSTTTGGTEARNLTQGCVRSRTDSDLQCKAFAQSVAVNVRNLRAGDLQAQLTWFARGGTEAKIAPAAKPLHKRALKTLLGEPMMAALNIVGQTQ